MRFLKLALLLVVVLGAAAFGVSWYRAGRAAGPTLTITSPDQVVGRSGSLELTVDAPDAQAVRVLATVDQNGQSQPVFSYVDGATDHGQVTHTHQTQVSIVSPMGTIALPGLVAGPARVTVTATRRVFLGLRTATAIVTKDIQVRLDPPKVAVVSTHHFVNLGGAEFSVLRVSPDDVQAGIRVGDASYPAYPGTAVGLQDSSLRVVFFALRYNQALATPMLAFARDGAGNEATTPLDHTPFAKVFLRSRIPIDRSFLARVVPAIASHVPELKIDTGTSDGLLKGFLAINSRLRRTNAETLVGLAAKTRPEILWKGAFVQMGNSQVESRFADQRTYYFENREIDRQVHLGFDLATVQQAPVHASNSGVVVFADFLGIYGNCVVIDHGLGVQTLYAHLSSIAVKPGDAVEKGDELGRTGATGLAGGDHLHFTILLQGTPVNSVEWWDPHWIEDRVVRKVREAGGRP